MIKSIFSKKYNTYLVICISILVIICIIFYTSKNEKFKDAIVIGEYDYLAPVTETISDELWNILLNNINKNITKDKFTFDTLKKKYTKFVSKDEINYYLENNMFPLNPYVKNLITIAIKNSIDKFKNSELKNSNPDDIIKDTMKQTPNRFVYSEYLLSPDMTESIKGDAYLIYTGEKPKPT